MHVNNNGGDVLPKPKTFLEAIEQLRSLWRQNFYHSPDKEVFISLEKSFLELAQRDLDTARRFVTKRKMFWLGTHTLSRWFIDQDGMSEGNEEIVIGDNHAELITRATYESHGIKYVITLSPFGSELKRIERFETTEKSGDSEPLLLEHCLITFERNRIVSFQEKRFRHPVVAM